jgi:putative heme iron utilization protein
MSGLDEAYQEFLELLQEAAGAHLATLDPEGCAEASYAPCVWHERDCYLFLSRLSRHCGNLQRNPRLGLMLLEDAGSAPNAFARRRIGLQGRAEVIARDDALFATGLGLFHRRFGEIMQVLESLPDFYLFRIEVESGSFVRGFGQAYALDGEQLDRLRHVDPRR